MNITDIKVGLVDHMGSDLNVVNAARVSFAKEVSEFDPTKDKGLINYLAKHGHWSPFAHTSVTLRIQAPIFLARQFVKHCVGGSWNEESRRYIVDTPKFFLPDAWREKPDNAKQGSGKGVVTRAYFRNTDTNELINDRLLQHVWDSLELYEDLLAADVAPEQARMVLPQNVMTNWMWTGSVMFFSRVCAQRKDDHAQKEAQDLANKISNIVAPLFPYSWEALTGENK